jgi:hypothetical protein
VLLVLDIEEKLVQIQRKRREDGVCRQCQRNAAFVQQRSLWALKNGPCIIMKAISELGKGTGLCCVVVSKVEAGTWPRATLDSDETTGRSRFCRRKVSATDQLAVDN